MDSYTRVIHKRIKIMIIVGLVGYAALLAVQLIVEEEEPQFNVGTNAPMAKMEITIKDAGIRLGDCPPSCNGKCAGKHQECSNTLDVAEVPAHLWSFEGSSNVYTTVYTTSDNVGIGSCRPRHSDEPHDCAIPTNKLEVSSDFSTNAGSLMIDTNVNSQTLIMFDPYPECTNLIFNAENCEQQGYNLFVESKGVTNQYVFKAGKIVEFQEGSAAE